MLPDDRTDALYHRYQGGGITIQGPDILVQKKITDNFAVTGNWYQDYISSASIDVKLSASPYKEKRTQETGGFMYLHGKSTYSAGLIHSDEPDYKANTTYYSVSQDMFGDLTTLSLTYKRGWDKVYRDLKDATTGRIINDPSFGGFDKDGNPISFKDADHRGYSLGLSQILTRTLIANFNYEVLTDQGYLQSPYRKILYLEPAGGKGFTQAEQIYPNTRTSNAGSLQLKYYLPWYRAAVTGLLPLLLRHLGYPRPHGGARLHPSRVQALDLRRLAALLHAECGQLLQRPVSARQFPELHGTRPRARGIQQLHGGRGRVLRLPDSAQSVGQQEQLHDPLRSPADRLQGLPQRAADRPDVRLYRRQRAVVQTERQHPAGLSFSLVLIRRRGCCNILPLAHWRDIS